MKLSRDRRREQLLDVAMEIVREYGADELTLGNLAARAGVSRPIAYGHFSTRSGLLVALFKRLEDKFVHTLSSALKATPCELQAVAEVMSAAYFNCLAEFGVEGPAISAALRGTEEMATQQKLMTDEYVGVMCEALRPFTPTEHEDLRLLCIGLLGAAEAFAAEVKTGRISDARAAHEFSRLIVKRLS